MSGILRRCVPRTLPWRRLRPSIGLTWARAPSYRHPAKFYLSWPIEPLDMFAIVGMLVVLGAVIGGFLMEHGPIRVLIQPSELLIIGGRRHGNAAGRQSAAYAERRLSAA